MKGNVHKLCCSVFCQCLSPFLLRYAHLDSPNQNADSTRENQPSRDAFSPLRNPLREEEAPPPRQRRDSGKKESSPESRSMLTLEELR